MGKKIPHLFFESGGQLPLETPPEMDDPIEINGDLDDGILEYGPDGDVRLAKESAPSKRRAKGDHFENLVYQFERGELDEIVSKIESGIKSDEGSRQDWYANGAQGLKMLNTTYSDEDKPFDGACGIKSTMMIQSSMDFLAEVSAELYSASGISKTEIIENETDETLEIADLLDEFTNNYLTSVHRNFVPEQEKATFWCWLMGSSFTKVWFDEVDQLVLTKAIQPNNLIFNQSVNDFEKCPRISYRRFMSKKELRILQVRGVYLDEKIYPYGDSSESISSGGESDQFKEELNKLLKVTDLVQRNEDDDIYCLMECYVDLEIEGFEPVDETGKTLNIPVPYIVTYDVESLKVLSIVRNYDEDDPSFKRKECFVNQIYMGGFGSLGIGMAQVISGLTEMTNKVSRMESDALQLYCMPAFFLSDTVKMLDTTVNIAPLQATVISSGSLGQPIRDLMQKFPAGEPSPMISAIKKEYEEEIKNVSLTANKKIEDMPSNVGETAMLAAMEGASKAQSGVMKRQHKALGDLLAMMYRLFPLYISGGKFIQAGINKKIKPEFFSEQFKIIPTSDPNAVTKSQRIIAAQAIVTMALQNPDIHNMTKVYAHMYRELPNVKPDELLLPEPDDEPVSSDPEFENYSLLTGLDVAVSMDQDDEAHIVVHEHFENQIKASISSGVRQPTDTSKLEAHIRWHKSNKSLKDAEAEANMSFGGDREKISIDVQNKMAYIQSKNVLLLQEEEAKKAASVPQPLDPAAVMLEEIKVKKEGIDSKRIQDDKQHELELIRLEIEEKKIQLKSEIDSAATQAKIEIEEKKLELQKIKMEIELALKEKEITLRELDLSKENI